MSQDPKISLKNKCSTCLKTIAVNHRSIHCQKCSRNFHIKCNNIDTKKYTEIKNGSMQEICTECTDIIPETFQPNDIPFSHISDTQFQSIVHNFEELPVSKNISKPKCTFCSKTIAKNHRKIVCEICKCQVHIKCNLTDVSSYNKIIKNRLPQKCKTYDPSQITIKPECCICLKK